MQTAKEIKPYEPKTLPAGTGLHQPERSSKSGSVSGNNPRLSQLFSWGCCGLTSLGRRAAIAKLLLLCRLSCVCRHCRLLSTISCCGCTMPSSAIGYRVDQKAWCFRTRCRACQDAGTRRNRRGHNPRSSRSRMRSTHRRTSRHPLHMKLDKTVREGPL